MRTNSRITRRDFAILGMITLLFTAAVSAAVFRSRETANRVRCASNLRQLGLAMMMYANNEVRNGQSFPRGKFDPKAKPTAFTHWKAVDPFGPDGPGPNDVSEPMFLLLRHEDLTPAVFVCPSTGKRTWDLEAEKLELPKLSNFPDGSHLDYSMCNPYPGQHAIETGFKWNMTLGADFALMADANPGGEGLPKLKRDAHRKEMMVGNSRNHQQ